MIYYFSGTGNSLWVAQAIAQALKVPLVNIAKHLFGSGLPAGSVPAVSDWGTELPVGFVLPVYGWDIPRVVRQFIEGMPRCTEPTPVFLVLTCGDDTGRTLQRFLRLAQTKNLVVHYAAAVQMPNTYVNLPGFDVDADTVRRRKLRQAPDAVGRIIRQLKDEEAKPGRVSSATMLPGAWPRLKTYVLGAYFRRFLMRDKPFHTTDICTRCGRCAKACPLGNITLAKGQPPQWHGHCTLCLRCYHTCPHHALHYGRQTRKKGQYLLSNYDNETSLAPSER